MRDVGSSRGHLVECVFRRGFVESFGGLLRCYGGMWV